MEKLKMEEVALTIKAYYDHAKLDLINITVDGHNHSFNIQHPDSSILIPEGNETSDILKALDVFHSTKPVRELSSFKYKVDTRTLSLPTPIITTDDNRKVYISQGVIFFRDFDTLQVIKGDINLIYFKPHKWPTLHFDNPEDLSSLNPFESK